jgi:hypothetical protein
MRNGRAYVLIHLTGFNAIVEFSPQLTETIWDRAAEINLGDLAPNVAAFNEVAPPLVRPMAILVMAKLVMAKLVMAKLVRCLVRASQSQKLCWKTQAMLAFKAAQAM